MRNITLSVDEKVWPLYVATLPTRNSTLNGLVRDYLTNLAAQEDRAKVPAHDCVS